MFEWLDKRRVLVTGHARSGTHICAAMVAYDTGLSFVKENAFNATDCDMFLETLGGKTGFVVPCNGLRKCIDIVGQGRDTITLIMHRDPMDIARSGFRISGALTKMFSSPSDAVPYIEQEYKNLTERCKELRYTFIITYKSLATHPLWCTKEERKMAGFFRPHQIQPEESVCMSVKCTDPKNLPSRKVVQK
ncbi:hypothetical protein GF373_17655 [bacterium]|nr:hypothetical protein [bacterium]